MSPKRTILLTAYAIHPFKGSEDGTAWNIVRSLSHYENLLIITRKNNRNAIDKYFREKENHLAMGSNTVQFAYFDYPKWSRWWKKGGRGALIYHYLWHLGVVFFILHRKFKFDITHHLNFHADWMPSFLWLLGKPFVWGPIGHHPRIPNTYLSDASLKYRIKNNIQWLVKGYFWRFSPTLFLTKHLAARVLVINNKITDSLRVKKSKVMHFPAIASYPNNCTLSQRKQGFNLLSVGRFVSLKGFELGIRAFARFYHSLPTDKRKDVQLVLIGKGPKEKKLKDIAQSEGLSGDSFSIINWLPQENLWEHYQNASALLFPSHEGAGMVVPEAMSFGLPVICFDNPGPGETCGMKAGLRIPYTDYADSIVRFAQAINTLWSNKALQQSMSKNAIERQQRFYSWSTKGARLHQVYNTLLAKENHNLIPLSNL